MSKLYWAVEDKMHDKATQLTRSGQKALARKMNMSHRLTYTDKQFKGEALTYPRYRKAKRDAIRAGTALPDRWGTGKDAYSVPFRRGLRTNRIVRNEHLEAQKLKEFTRKMRAKMAEEWQDKGSY